MRKYLLAAVALALLPQPVAAQVAGDPYVPQDIVVAPGAASFSGGAVMSPLYAASGSAAAPGYAFSSDHATGVYLPTTGTIGFSSGGVQSLKLDSSLVATFAGNIVAPSITLSNILTTYTNLTTDQGSGPAIALSGTAFADGSTPLFCLGTPSFSDVNSAVCLAGYFLETSNASLLVRSGDSGQGANFGANGFSSSTGAFAIGAAKAYINGNPFYFNGSSDTQNYVQYGSASGTLQLHGTNGIQLVGNSNVTGTLVANGNTTHVGNSNFIGAVIDQNTLIVVGDANFKSTVEVNGAGTWGGNVTANNNVTIAGTTLVAAGTAAVPSAAFSAHPGYGLSYDSTNSGTAISAAGVQAASVTITGSGTTSKGVLLLGDPSLAGSIRIQSNTFSNQSAQVGFQNYSGASFADLVGQNIFADAGNASFFSVNPTAGTSVFAFEQGSSGALFTGLRYASAGLLHVIANETSSGLNAVSTSPGAMRVSKRVVPKTANYTVVPSDSWADFTNQGAGSTTVTFTLPTTPNVNAIASFTNVIGATAPINVATGGSDKIFVGGVSGVSNTQVSTSVQYATATFEYLGNNVWAAMSSVGTWTSN